MANSTIDQRPAQLDFQLQRMELIYDASGGRADHAHRHDYYTVLLVEQAQGDHLIDYECFPFGEKEVHFVSPGQVHQVLLQKRPLGAVITFSSEFLVANNIPESFISNINLFQPFGKTPPLQVDESNFERLQRLIMDMEACLPLAEDYRTRALGALLQLLLIYAHQSTDFDASQTDVEHTGICMLRDFKKLINQRYQDWHKVKDYAAEIHISPKHLSQTVKNLTGKVAKDHIQDRILLEAKRLLLHTDLSVKEVAYKVGFEEPLHFSGFFKRQTGQSPSAFRESYAY
jgi:AraC-like DNA-binding protein